jgi:glucosamine-phosphate N-acetyltransferase
MAYHVRLLNKDDIEPVMKFDMTNIYKHLSNNAILDTYPDASDQIINYFRDKLDDPDYYIYIVVCQYQLTKPVILIGIGTLYIEHKLIHNFKNCGHIEDVVIHPDYRHKRLGKSIILEMVNMAKLNNCYKIILNCKSELVDMYKHILSDQIEKICIESSVCAYL